MFLCWCFTGVVCRPPASTPTSVLACILSKYHRWFFHELKFENNSSKQYSYFIAHAIISLTWIPTIALVIFPLPYSPSLVYPISRSSSQKKLWVMSRLCFKSFSDLPLHSELRLNFLLWSRRPRMIMLKSHFMLPFSHHTSVLCAFSASHKPKSFPLQGLYRHFLWPVRSPLFHLNSSCHLCVTISEAFSLRSMLLHHRVQVRMAVNIRKPQPKLAKSGAGSRHGPPGSVLTSILLARPTSVCWCHPQAGCKVIAVVLGILPSHSCIWRDKRNFLFLKLWGGRKPFFRSPLLQQIFCCLIGKNWVIC